MTKIAAVTTNKAISEEIPNAPKGDLMKYFNNSWIPAVEVNMMKWIDANGNYQYDKYVASKKYLKNNRVSIDVGANLGLFSRRMSEDFQEVHCFEPVPIARACLMRNATGNNCTVYSNGLGNSEYETEISYCEISIGGSTIGRHANETRAENDQLVEHQIKLKIKTLDSFNFKNVDYIKIDIQGYELEMLQGAKRTLIENDPVILIELMADGKEHVEVPRFLESLGYECKARIGKEGIFVKTTPLKKKVTGLKNLISFKKSK